MAKRNNKKWKTLVISLEGSLIVPSIIDVGFLKKFKQLILRFVKRKERFIIICGGGETSRRYQAAASQLTRLTNEDADWLGIHATRLNAHLLRTIFRKCAHPRIIKDYQEKIELKKPILIAAGYRPGCSTDYDAVMLAKNLGVKILLNLTDVDYVYDKDPAKYKDAKLFKRMNWKEYREIFGSKWSPGLNAPFDPVAAKEAEKINLKVIVMNGRDIKNIDNFLNGRNVEGTIIKS